MQGHTGVPSPRETVYASYIHICTVNTGTPAYFSKALAKGAIPFAFCNPIFSNKNKPQRLRLSTIAVYLTTKNSLLGARLSTKIAANQAVDRSGEGSKPWTLLLTPGFNGILRSGVIKMSFDEILPQVRLLIYLVFHLCFGELPGSLPCWWSSMAHTNAVLTPQATCLAHM